MTPERAAHRKRVVMVANAIRKSIERQLAEADLRFGMVFEQSQPTDSVYITFSLFGTDSQRYRPIGVKIRVSDHPASKFPLVNYSFPFRRVFGIAYDAPPGWIAVKTKWIAQQMIDRASWCEAGIAQAEGQGITDIESLPKLSNHHSDVDS